MKDINDRLLKIKADLREKQRLEKILNDAMNQKRELEGKKAQLYKQLQKEEKDVKKLEGMSFSNFINTILGTKWEKLDEEKKELLSAKLKYDAICDELNELISDIEKVKANISKLGNLDYEYKKLIREKEELLKYVDDEVAAKLERITEEESLLMHRKKELEEAISAGNELLYSLDRIEKSLKSAGNWGMWDIFGGDMIATMVKHSKLDSAKCEISRAQSLFMKFHRELNDVGGYIDIQLNIGSFLTFADYFFDGLFSDLAVQSRIRDAENRVMDARYKVNSIVIRLKDELKEVNSRVETINRERLKIIEQA